jgi:AcrR family transcriptional regulator
MSETGFRSRPAALNRRDQILDETLRIVGQRGYHGFGISELAERCGLSKPGVLHHFGTKEQLLIAMLEDCEAKEKAELAELFLPAYEAADSHTRRKMFHETMVMVMARAIARPELMRLEVVLRAEAVNSAHPAHQFFVARERAHRTRIAKRLAPLYPRAQSIARCLLATMSGLQEQWLREDERFDLLGEWDHMLNFLLPPIRDEANARSP